MEKQHLGQATRAAVEPRPVAQKTSLRVSQACFRCQQKKIRCDGKMPRCSTCTIKQLDCQYRQFQNKRGKGKTSLLDSKQHIQNLQDRLSKMESLLQHSGLALQDEQSQKLIESPSLQSQNQPSASAFPSQNSNLLGNKQKSPVVEALLSGHNSILSNSFETLGNYWHQVAQRLRQYKMGDPVSPQEPEAVLLILSIKEVCAEFPLFHIPWFLERLRYQHTAETCDRPSWWACLNAAVALSISQRIAIRSFREVSMFVWAFFKNAFAVFPDIIIKQSDDLLAIQALLAMAMIMKTSADSRTTALLVSNACRIIHTTGLYTRSGGNSQLLVEKNMRNRVFWIAFILETEMSTICGIPSLLEKDDIDIDLPTEWTLDSCGLVTLDREQRDTKVFRLRAELANIQSSVQKKLYSAKSLKLSGNQLLEKIQEIQCQLREWRSRVPSEIRPEFGCTLMSSLRDTPLVNLHFMYFNCVSMTYWTAMRGNPSQAAMDNAYSVSQYTAAAKATISLLNCIPGSQFSGLWQTLSFAVSASLVLLAGVLKNPYDSDVQANFELLKSAVRWIVRLRDEEGCDLATLRAACSAMVRIAESAINGSGGALQPTGDQLPDVAAHTKSMKLAALIRGCTHPIYLAQSLMGNLPNRDTDSSRTLSGMLGVIWEEGTGYGPFAPDILRPHTYGFGISGGTLVHPTN